MDLSRVMAEVRRQTVSVLPERSSYFLSLKVLWAFFAVSFKKCFELEGVVVGAADTGPFITEDFLESRGGCDPGGQFVFCVFRVSVTMEGQCDSCVCAYVWLVVMVGVVYCSYDGVRCVCYVCLWCI